NIEILSGPIAPGNHTISVLIDYRGNGYGVFAYLKEYKFTVRSSYTFTAAEGKQTQVTVVGLEKGGITTQLKDRPAVEFKVNVVAEKPTAAPRTGNCNGSFPLGGRPRLRRGGPGAGGSAKPAVLPRAAGDRARERARQADPGQGERGRHGRAPPHPRAGPVRRGPLRRCGRPPLRRRGEARDDALVPRRAVLPRRLPVQEGRQSPRPRL